MLIENPIIQKKGNEVMLTTNIIFTSGKHVSLFFSVNKKYEPFITNDASPFLAALLLPAMKLKEDIHIDGTISAKLLANTKKIMRIVSDWHIGLDEIQVTTRNTTTNKTHSQRIGTFFSGGVDSFTTYLKNKDEAKDKINGLIFVHGFDIFLKDQVTFDKTAAILQSFANEEKVELISPKTNLREITDPILDWGYSHGGALAAIALLLSNGFCKIYIPSTYSVGHLFPWGSHPELDPLWSTEKVAIIHDASDLSRQEKMKQYISKSSLALQYLRVCWSNSGYNCGKCSKCIRTMLSLHVTSALHKSKTFPTILPSDLIRNFFLTSKSQVVFFEELLLELKNQKRDPEIQDAIEHMIKKSKNPDIKRTIRSVVSFFDRKFNHDRLFWYFAKKGVTRP